VKTEAETLDVNNSDTDLIQNKWRFLLEQVRFFHCYW